MAQKEKQKVQKLVSSAKTEHYNNRIIGSSSAKELHSTMNELPGTAKSPTLPTSYSTAELLLKFKICVTSLARHLSSRALRTHFSPEHRSFAFILSLK